MYSREIWSRFARRGPRAARVVGVARVTRARRRRSLGLVCGRGAVVSVPGMGRGGGRSVPGMGPGGGGAHDLLRRH